MLTNISMIPFFLPTVQYEFYMDIRKNSQGKIDERMLQYVSVGTIICAYILYLILKKQLSSWSARTIYKFQYIIKMQTIETMFHRNRLLCLIVLLSLGEHFHQCILMHFGHFHSNLPFDLTFLHFHSYQKAFIKTYVSIVTFYFKEFSKKKMHEQF